MHWMQPKKPQLYAKYGFWKIKKNCHKKYAFLSKITVFAILSGFFFKNGTLRRVDFFCVAYSASNPFFWAILINNTTIFQIFYCKGGSLWFRTSQKPTTHLKLASNQKIYNIVLNRITKRSWIHVVQHV